jgi:hypothetical protein
MLSTPVVPVAVVLLLAGIIIVPKGRETGL